MVHSIDSRSKFQTRFKSLKHLLPAVGGALWLLLAGGTLWPAVAAEDAAPVVAGTETLAIGETDFIKLVAEENQEVKRQRLETLISEQGIRQATSIFEPNLTLGWEIEHSLEQNDAALQYQRSSLSTYEYTDRTYSSSVGGLAPLGTRYELFYDLYDPENSLQRASEYGRENTVKTGVRITQPLLKNFGPGANRANQRVAEKEHEIEQARLLRVRMTSVHQAAAAYAELQLAQARLALEDRILALTREGVEIVTRTEAEGRVARAAVFQAESSLARREARISFANKIFRRASAMVRQMLVGTTGQTLVTLCAADAPPGLTPGGQEPQPDLSGVLERRPEYLEARLHCELEALRLDYAKNQKLPELNLKMSMGKSGLDTDWSDANNRLDSSYGFWSVGAEVIVPMMGGKKGRSNLEAARLRKQQVDMALEHMANLIQDEVMAARAEETQAFKEARRLARVVENLEKIVVDGEKRRQEGRVGRYETIAQETEWLQARLELLEKIMEHKKVLLAVWLAEGRILERLRIDATS